MLTLCESVRLRNVELASQLKSVIWKSGKFCSINQLSNDFQQINLITCKNLIHCGYFEYKTFSDNQVLTEIWLDRDMASQTF